MLSYVTGDLFKAPAQTLVNTVNTRGVMGKGIALTFRKLYPDMFTEYQRLCEERQIAIGSLYLYRTPNKLILNFPTKSDWRQPSKLSYIEAGLAKFIEIYDSAGIHSIAFPPLGCGNGELDFDDVRPLMERYLQDLPIRVFIYGPLKSQGTPEHRDIAAMKAWLSREPTSLPFAEVWDELVMLFRKPRSVRTSRSAISAQIDSENATIRVRAGEKTILFQKAEVQSLWRDLRERLIVPVQGAIGRKRDVSYLVPVLTELPYVRAIDIADDYASLEFGPSVALQLSPPFPAGEKHTQLELAST